MAVGHDRQSHWLASNKPSCGKPIIPWTHTREKERGKEKINCDIS